MCFTYNKRHNAPHEVQSNGQPSLIGRYQEIGTVFEIDAGVDTGRIIDQVPVRVEPGDTEEALHERIKVAERALLVDTVNALADAGAERET